MLSTLIIFFSCVILSFGLVSDISHRFLQRDPEFEQRIYEPLYTSHGYGGSQLSPLYGMTNSHLLSLTDLLRKRTI